MKGVRLINSLNSHAIAGDVLLIDAGSLRKIFELERKRSYADLAVIGGLDRFLQNWSGQAVESITSPRILKRFRELFNSSYASLTKEQRREWIKSALDFLADLEGKVGVEAVSHASVPAMKSSPKTKKPPATKEPAIKFPIFDAKLA